MTIRHLTKGIKSIHIHRDMYRNCGKVYMKVENEKTTGQILSEAQCKEN